MPAPERLERNRKALRAELMNWGFTESPGEPNHLYSDDMPDVRFFIGNNAVRFDKKGEPDTEGEVTWKMWEVYRLVDEAHLAVQVLQQPNRHFKVR